MADYLISLQARNEGLRYEDDSGVYRFNLSRQSKTWVVHLPPTKEKDEEFPCYYLSALEREVLFSRIEAYLTRIWWLGLWPVCYEVRFEG